MNRLLALMQLNLNGCADERRYAQILEHLEWTVDCLGRAPDRPGQAAAPRTGPSWSQASCASGAGSDLPTPVTVTEGRMGGGLYEAVVASLASGWGRAGWRVGGPAEWGPGASRAFASSS